MVFYIYAITTSYNLKNLKNSIDELVEFGSKPILNFNENESKILVLLTELYCLYLKMDYQELDSETCDNTPEFRYEDVRKFVAINFPNYGWYHSLSNSHKCKEDEELAIGDKIDDLTDIVKDMMDIKWAMENESFQNGLWLFKFLMQYHCEQHLVDFLKYAKDLKS
ncbi:DUF5063 domain-containing protein [Hyunsoonleella pacifica]|uniref:DUF5063 domain-containing protein n=1 Tax=Hyunsoonleella pacifica TaxID=1080224 RepID=A0A4Q9FM98_9FLAO|nr:DUF5063 domain-containing protein [Hyunsoonleella pacifica]TBN15311.1 DUF5063 domain-containing protein [Hyunsoonleella pacifica]GGD22993.1 hypothetical protein GCM10011368_26350 [Hyunsoonleella pacifica]